MIEEIVEVDISVVEGDGGTWTITDVVGDAVGSGRVGVGIEEIAQVADGEEGYSKVVIEIGHRVANAICL